MKNQPKSFTVRNIELSGYTSLDKANKYGSYIAEGDVLLDTEGKALLSHLESLRELVPDGKAQEFIPWAEDTEQPMLFVKCKLRAYGTGKGGKKYKKIVKVIGGNIPKVGDTVNITVSPFIYEFAKGRGVSLTIKEIEVIIEPNN